MTALLTVTLIIALGCIYWINCEQADYDRAHYDPRKERKDE